MLLGMKMMDKSVIGAEKELNLAGNEHQMLHMRRKSTFATGSTKSTSHLSDHIGFVFVN